MISRSVLFKIMFAHLHSVLQIMFDLVLILNFSNLVLVKLSMKKKSKKKKRKRRRRRSSSSSSRRRTRRGRRRRRRRLICWGLTPLQQLWSYHGGRWRICVSWLSHTSTNTFFQSHGLLFSHASADVRGENTPERKFASTWYRTHNHQVMSLTSSPLSNTGRAKKRKEEEKRKKRRTKTTTTKEK